MWKPEAPKSHTWAVIQQEEEDSLQRCRQWKPALDSRSPDLLVHSATEEVDEPQSPLQCFLRNVLLPHPLQISDGSMRRS